MPRLVYLHQYFVTPDRVGGTRSFEFARRLARAGYDVHMVTSRAKSEKPATTWHTSPLEGFTVHSIDVPYSNSMSYPERIQAFFRFALRASLKARSLKPDIVFATSTPLTIAVPGLYSTLLSKAKLVLEIRDLWPKVPIAMGALRNPLSRLAARALEKAAYRGSAAIVALSEGMKEGIIDTGVAPSRVTVIPNSADIEAFSVPDSAGLKWRESHPELSDRPIILYCGTFGLVNNVSYLVHVAKSMLDVNPRIAFVAIGGGRETEVVRELARELGVQDSNFFQYSPIPKQDVPAVFNASALTVSTVLPVQELEANSANKFFDSLAAGRPVAVNYGGWQRDVLAKNDAGIYLDASNCEAAAQTLNQLISDQARLSAMSQNAKNLGATAYSREGLVARLISVLETVA